MDLSNIFPEAPRVPVPGHANYPAIPDSSGGTEVFPPAYLRGRADVDTLGVVGRVAISSIADVHRAPTIAEMQRVQALMVLWRRFSLGPLYGSTADFLEGGLNWLQSDHVFDIVSASGNELTLAAPNSGFDVRRFAAGTRIVENPLWFPESEDITRYLFEYILGTVQFGDEVRPHPNSVLWGKAWPLVVRLVLPNGYEAGDNFTLVLCQDVEEIATARDSEEDAPVSVAVRMHVLLPAAWLPLIESRPMYCRRRQQVWSAAQVEALADGVTELLSSTGGSGRIAYPTGASVFRVERLESGEDAEDITAAFVAAGRVACTHESGGAWRTRVWLGETIQGEEAAALLAEGKALRITWWHEESGATVSTCQARCHFAREDTEGRVYCALHNAGAMSNELEEWVPDEPTGLAQFNRPDCYQWSGGGSAAHAGCNKFQVRVPSPPSVWGAFWDQLWAETGVVLAQQVLSLPDYIIKRHGVEGLLHVGGGRINREIEFGELREITAQFAQVGYLDGDLEFVVGLLQGSTTLHDALGPNYDDEDTWGPPGLLAQRGAGVAIEDNLGNAWSDATDPDGGQRNCGLVPAKKAESASRGGRSAGSAARLVMWRDVAVSLMDHQDGAPRVSGPFTWTSEEDGTMRIKWTNVNPLAYFAVAVAGGVVAIAVLSEGMLRLEAVPAWRTVTFFNEDVPPAPVTGTIRAGGTVARPRAEFELLNDPLHGDGNNTQRGLVPGDVVQFSGGELPEAVTAQGFEVVRVLPFGGGSFAPGWNNDPDGTPPTNLLLPQEYITGDAWGLRRDVVWLRPRDITVHVADVDELEGASFSGGQQGVFGGATPPTVSVAAAGSTDWQVVTPVSINYLTGEIVLAAEDVAAFASAPFDVLVQGTLYDRRQGARAAHVNGLRGVFEAMDTFRVGLGSSPATINVALAQREYECAEGLGWYDGSTWVPGGYFATDNGSPAAGYSFAFGRTPLGANLEPGDLYSWEVLLNAAPVPIAPTGLGATAPDGVEVEEASLTLTISGVTETIYEESATTGSSIATGSTDSHNDGATLRISVVAYDPDEPLQFKTMWVSDAVEVPADTPTRIDMTEFAQRWFDEFRRDERHGYGLLVIPDNGVDPVQGAELVGFVPVKSYTNFQPLYVDCNPSVPNDNFNQRAYTLRQRTVAMDAPLIENFTITLAALPDEIGGLPIADLRLNTNEARNWRSQRLYSVEPD